MTPIPYMHGRSVVQFDWVVGVVDDVETLRQFLVAAKRMTYASGKPGQVEQSPGLKLFHFEANGFRYQDAFYGSTSDIGQEIVWYDETPIWGMNYRGGLLPDHEAKREKTFAFLRLALSQVQLDAPLRGPPLLLDGDWLYQFKVEGDMHSFIGTEIIRCRGEIVFERIVTGGDIVN